MYAGYIDPKYVQTGKYKPCSDVYSMGVVVMQVLTGQKNPTIKQVAGWLHSGSLFGCFCVSLLRIHSFLLICYLSKSLAVS